MHERHTLTSFGSSLPSLTTFGGYQQALRTAIYWHRYLGVAGKWWRGEGLVKAVPESGGVIYQ